MAYLWILLLFLIPSYSSCSDMALLVNKTNNVFEMTCIATENETIAWISSNFDKVDQVSPGTDNPNEASELRSINYRLPIVLDRRWEDFRTTNANALKARSVVIGQQHVSILHISLRFNGPVDIHLKSGSITWCATLSQDLANKTQFLPKCAPGENIMDEWAPWRHYSIYKENKEFYLINGGQPMTYMNTTDFKLAKLSLQSKHSYQWKLHDYYLKDYLNPAKLTNDNKVAVGNLSLFVSLCKRCSLNITTNNISHLITSETQDKWYKFSPNHSVNHLKYELIPHDVISPFAAIDIKLNYEKSNVINITVNEPTIYGCQNIINSSDILKIEKIQNLNEIEEYGSITQSTIPALRTFGNKLSCEKYTGDRYCAEHLVCDPKNKCYCPHGYTRTQDYCKKKCQNNTWGYQCSYQCSNHCEENKCHYITGDCSKNCKIGYKGTRCNDKLGKPTIIYRSATNITFDLNTVEIPRDANIKASVELTGNLSTNNIDYNIKGSNLTIFHLKPATMYNFMIRYCEKLTTCFKVEFNSSTICRNFNKNDFSSNQNETSIEISIKGNVNISQYCATKYYKITIEQNARVLDYNGKAVFANLKPNTNYEVHFASNFPKESVVQAINFKTSVRTKQSQPDMPHCSHDSVEEDKVILQWNITNGPLKHFVITLQNDNSTRTISNNITKYTLTKLKPSTLYIVHIYGVNEDSNHGDACEIKISTKPSKPNPQGTLDVSNCNSNKCTVNIPSAENNSYVYIIVSDRTVCKNGQIINNISQIKGLSQNHGNSTDNTCNKWVAYKSNIYNTNITTEVDLDGNGDFEFQAIYVNEFGGNYQITSATPVRISPKKGGAYFLLLLLLLIPMSIVVAFCAYRKYKYKVETREDPTERENIFAPQETPNLMSSKQTEMRKSEVQYFLKNVAKGDFSLEDEFKGIDSPKGTKENAKLEQNKIKNRYQNVIPYDSTRVILKSTEDYINANYILGARGEKTYIATQCPKLITQNDFWEMIWQEGVHIIVCLATLSEGSDKMTQYWPDEYSNKMHRNVSVTHKKTELKTDFNIRILELTNFASGRPSREVYLFNYVSWPDQSIPLFPLSLLNFAKYVNSYSGECPIVVHCSAGIGRTGTYILCDQYLNKTSADYYDVPRDLYLVRGCRSSLVSTLSQYQLIYCLLDEIINGKDNNIDIDTFSLYTYASVTQFVKSDLEHITARNYINDILFPKFPNVSFVPEKTRIPKVRPNGPGMLFLSCYPPNDENSNYINAVQLPGYQTKDKYISTQLPLPGTVGDFWRMIYTRRIDVVLALQERIEDDSTLVDFWPPEGTILTPVDFLEITLKDVYHEDFHDVLKLELYNNKQKELVDIKLIIFKSWYSNKITPNNLEVFYHFYNYTSKLTSKSPVLLCCYDGAIGCGLYVATNLLLNKIKFDKMFNIRWAVRGIRGYREEFVKSEEQMIFLYKLALYFVNNHMHQCHDYENPIPEDDQDDYQNICNYK